MPVSRSFRILAVSILIFFSSLAFAVDLLVDDSTDTDSFGDCLSGSGCSLRQALMYVDNNPGNSYTIYLTHPGPYPIDLGTAGDNFPITGDLDINVNNLGNNGSLVIRPSSGTVVIEAGVFGDRIFDIRNSGGATGTSVTFRNITIQRADFSTTNQDGAGIRFLASNATLILENVTLRNNVTTASAKGGGLYIDASTSTVSLNNVTTDDGNISSGSGGGMYIASGSVTISNSTLSSNSTGVEGGAIYNAGANLAISNSTISYNTATGSGGGIANTGTISSLSYSTVGPSNTSEMNGGGIYNTGTATFANSTISGNLSEGEGGGVYNVGASANISVNNITIAYNTADYLGNGSGAENGGGVQNLSNAIFTFSNSLKAKNLNTGGGSTDCGGDSFFVSQDFNIIEDNSGCNALISGSTGNNKYVPTSLGLLTDNGGPTLTHALPSGSEAIDSGNPGLTGTLCESFDQRGYSRPVDGDADTIAYCDVGSYEAPDPSTPPPFSGGGCYIATAAYGTAMEKDVVTLRRFRDHYLLTNKPGTLFTELYYKFSPPVAAKISTSETLREWARASLIPLVSLGRLLADVDEENN